MYKKLISLKNIVILLSGILFVLFAFCEIKAEKSRCMGLSFITEEDLQQIPLQQTELGNIVSLGGHLTAYDESQNKIFIPCDVTVNTRFYELEGQLESILPGYELYFLWESAFEIMKEAVMYGCNFTIYAIDGEGHYTSYSVVFTTLPIIEMHGEISYIDEREREVYVGEVTIWEPKQKDTERLIIQTSNLEWHERGFSSSSLPMPPLKLNLKEKSGNQNNLELFGFESDDDYLLNPMGFDDTYVREKLAMDLWNEMADGKNSSLKMSQGEYCELIINGKYLGLRLVQNKIEKSYLKLDENATLLKGKNVNAGTVKPPEEVYELVFSNQDEETTYRTISDFFYQTDFSNVNLDNWIDLQLLLQLGNMIDNETYKNIYYVIERSGEEETLSLIPWDTDMSFGICWSPDGFRLKPENVESITYRIEYESLLAQYPKLNEMLAKRWKELRNENFSQENIFQYIDSYTNELNASGAIQRDFHVLGWNTWGEEDTVENFKSYITKRLDILDNYYGAI